MSGTPLSQASHLEQLRNSYIQLEKEIEGEDNEKLQIYKKINLISEKIQKLDSELFVLTDERDNVDQLITEISKGFSKIEASTQSLLLLTSRQLKMLKRKDNN